MKPKISYEELFYETSTPEEIEEYEAEKKLKEKEHDEFMMSLARMYLTAHRTGPKSEKAFKANMKKNGMEYEKLDPYVSRVIEQERADARAEAEKEQQETVASPA